MRSLVKFLIVLFLVALGRASAIEVEKRDNITLKTPIVATPSEHWYMVPFSISYRH
jgi:hypothetical protein